MCAEKTTEQHQSTSSVCGSHPIMHLLPISSCTSSPSRHAPPPHLVMHLLPIPSCTSSPSHHAPPPHPIMHLLPIPSCTSSLPQVQGCPHGPCLSDDGGYPHMSQEAARLCQQQRLAAAVSGHSIRTTDHTSECTRGGPCVDGHLGDATITHLHV